MLRSGATGDAELSEPTLSILYLRCGQGPCTRLAEGGAGLSILYLRCPQVLAEAAKGGYAFNSLFEMHQTLHATGP